MKTRLSAPFGVPLALAAFLLAGGCNKQSPQQTAAQPNQQNLQQQQQQLAQQQQQLAQQQQALQQQQQQAAAAAAAQQQSSASSTRGRRERRASEGSSEQASTASSASYTIPAGTHISVTTREELGSKISQSGQSFSATVASPIVVDGRTVVRSGSTATGTVVDAKSQGRIKGSGELDLRLDSIHAGGQDVQVETSALERAEKGKGKRTGLFALGGGGGGALIGGLAGGGKGALLGGLLGAGGGTAAGAFTGNKQVVIPAETTLTFRLEHSVTVGR